MRGTLGSKTCRGPLASHPLARSPVLDALDLRFELIDSIFGGSELLACALQHLDDGAAGLLPGNAFTSHLLGGEFEDLVRYADRALTDGVPAPGRATCHCPPAAHRAAVRLSRQAAEGTVDGWCEGASMPEPGLASMHPRTPA
jgi:hypothetical protein